MSGRGLVVLSRRASIAAIAIFAAFALAGCGGGGSSSAVPSGTNIAGGGNTSLSAIVSAGAPITTASGTRKPQYVTSQTAGIIVYSWTGSSTPSNPTAVAQGNWSSTSPLCTAASGGGRNCTISFNAPASSANTTIVVDVYDKAPATCGSNGFCTGGPATGAHLISVGVASNQTIVSNGTNSVQVTTFGVLASMQIAVTSGAVTATGLDADGLAIGSQCIDGSTNLALTQVSGISLSATGFSVSGTSFAASSCSATGSAPSNSTGIITATASSSRGTLSGVTGYDVVSNGGGSSGPVAVQTVTATGGSIGLSPSNSASNSSSNFGGGSFSFGVGSVSGTTTVTIAEVGSVTLGAFIPASTKRTALYSSGGASNPNVVLYGFAVAESGGTVSLVPGGTLQVTNGALADALGAGGTLYVATLPTGAASCTSSCADAGSVAYSFYGSGAEVSDPTGSCTAAAIDTNCLVLGTFTPIGSGISASGMYMLYLPGGVVVSGAGCSTSVNACTTSTLTSTGNTSISISQPGPSGTTFTLSSDTCTGIVSFPSSVSANPGSFNLTTPSGPLNGSCLITVGSSSGGAPATISVSVAISPPTPTVSVAVGAPTGTNYSGFAWQQTAEYFVLGSAGTLPITFTSQNGSTPSLTLSITVTTPSGHSNTGLVTSGGNQTFQINATGVSVPSSGSATPVTLTYTGAGQYKASASNPTLGAVATIGITGPSNLALTLNNSLNSGAFLSSSGNGSYTLTVDASCLSIADDNNGNNENSNLDIAEDKTTPSSSHPPGCP